MKTEAVLIFPHHLFRDHPAAHKGRLHLLVEDPLFFNDLRYKTTFHKQKILFHKATMNSYRTMLEKRGFKALLIPKEEIANPYTGYAQLMKRLSISKIFTCSFDDYILKKRITDISNSLSIPLEVLDSPGFLIPEKELTAYFSSKKRYFFHSFYIYIRKRLGLLLEEDGSPLMGRWSFDDCNRKRIGKDVLVPLPAFGKPEPCVDAFSQEVEKEYEGHPGSLQSFSFATTHSDATRLIDDFLKKRFSNFGTYQDAILKDSSFLYHSLLSPYLNSGLITPGELIKKTMDYSREHKIPYNSLEGFIRQVAGWREFVRGVYLASGTRQRTTNFFQHKNPIPASFYTAKTGIEPIDCMIRKASSTAYLHHIERLMVLGNFMLLCEIDPDEVYRWFMEFFIDAYDWVMVPNVYGMSQFADGGLMTTKPYISSSNYILKMSDFKKGEWSASWDALFWRFLFKHEKFFQNQPRLSMLMKQCKKKGILFEEEVKRKGESFLETLYK